MTRMELAKNPLKYKQYRVKAIHFVGIGGAGMSGIAEVLLNEGYSISGSDISANHNTCRLMALGAKVVYQHEADNIKGVDVLVVSSAISNDNPEILAARRALIPIISRAEMLAELMRFRFGIAIAGSHGKTTTTSLAATLLTRSGDDPTFVIGGILHSSESPAKLGKSPYLVAEADESDASFVHLKPMIALVTNIDREHMKTYQEDLGQLQASFINFLHQLPFYGLAILCAEDKHIATILSKIERPIKTYGFSSRADIQALEIEPKGLKSSFILRRSDHRDLPVTLNLPGRHNILNALAVAALATELQISDTVIQSTFAEFSGVSRRFQVLGELRFKAGNATLIDDYGHHPSEIEAVLQTIRTIWPHQRLVMVYQPHRYTRTLDLFEDFVKVLSQTDILLLLEVYSAGEIPIPQADTHALCQAILKKGERAPFFIPDSKILLESLDKVIRPSDILLLQGAGNIAQLALELMAKRRL